jgi:hypothetical protein
VFVEYDPYSIYPCGTWTCAWRVSDTLGIYPNDCTPLEQTGCPVDEHGAVEPPPLGTPPSCCYQFDTVDKGAWGDPTCRAAQCAGGDKDGDGWCDDAEESRPADNCPDVPNPDQLDRGGFGSGSLPDGIGDACQCGDVDGDGLVTPTDAEILFDEARGLTTGVLHAPALADLDASGTCSGTDATILFNAFRGDLVAASKMRSRCFNSGLICNPMAMH